MIGLIRGWTGLQRTTQHNTRLGVVLACVAGATNAGGFLAVGQYTSHMTGFVSLLADNLVLGNTALVLSACGALLAFLCGAAATSLLVNWARHHRLRSSYALPLLLEAALMLLFGVLGAAMLAWPTPFAVPLAVLLLSFIMGLQNATVTKMSSSQIRTTHMTGVITDLGMELGRALYWNRHGSPPEHRVHANHVRLRLFAGLLSMFLLGGIAGALGFRHLGFVFVVPLAVVLCLLSLPPLWAGVFLGGTIHDVAQVVVAGYSLGQEAGDTASIVKLLRVSLLVLVVLVISIVVGRLPSQAATKKATGKFSLPVPSFLVLFVILVGVHSAGWMSPSLQQSMAATSRACLMVGVTALGMKTSFVGLARTGWRPAALMFITTVWIALFVLGAIEAVMHF